jgi:tellurite resistance protein TerC
MEENIYVWLGFFVLVIGLLILDLKVFNRKPHQIKIKEALWWSAFWISLSLIFNLVVYFWLGKEKAMEFLAAYIIEKSLSIDNLFVFIIIFSFFEVKPKYQHTILFWGILGAMAFRAVFIIAGITLIQNFHWIIYIFGAFLIYTGIKTPFEKESHIDLDKKPFIKFLIKIIPISTETHGNKLFVKSHNKLIATPLFLTLMVIEISDLVFAVDSVPAVIAISRDTFIVYTSNICAILGLRALYFALAAIINSFKYLKYGLAAILVFVGVKMCISGFYKIPIAASLLFIFLLFLISILTSIFFPHLEDDIKHIMVKNILHQHKESEKE